MFKKLASVVWFLNLSSCLTATLGVIVIATVISLYLVSLLCATLSLTWMFNEHAHVVCLLNKNSCLATALGVKVFVTVISLYHASLCWAIYVQLKCSTNHSL
jgi:hypothetical protein